MRNPSAPTDLQTFKAAFFTALAHSTRIRILEVLRAGQRSAQELQSARDLDQAVVLRQLAVLRARRIVGARKEVTTVRYAVHDPRLGDLLDMARAAVHLDLCEQPAGGDPPGAG
jgi:ArsR family transcriptional regulator